MAEKGKKVMVTVRKAPHGSIYVQESIATAETCRFPAGL